MTTIRNIALAATVAAGLLVSTSAHAGDLSADRTSQASRPQGHPVAAAVTVPAQQAKAGQVEAARTAGATAHACACAHRS